jgi:hypothetical protein
MNQNLIGSILERSTIQNARAKKGAAANNKVDQLLALVGGSLWLPPPLKLVAMIQLKYC